MTDTPDRIGIPGTSDSLDKIDTSDSPGRSDSLHILVQLSDNFRSNHFYYSGSSY